MHPLRVLHERFRDRRSRGGDDRDEYTGMDELGHAVLLDRRRRWLRTRSGPWYQRPSAVGAMSRATSAQSRRGAKGEPSYPDAPPNRENPRDRSGGVAPGRRARPPSARSSAEPRSTSVGSGKRST